VGFFGFALGFLLVNPFSLFHFSIKLLITYQKKKNVSFYLSLLVLIHLKTVSLSSLVLIGGQHCLKFPTCLGY
jgi:hypothetical protein